MIPRLRRGDRHRQAAAEIAAAPLSIRMPLRHRPSSMPNAPGCAADRSGGAVRAEAAVADPVAEAIRLAETNAAQFGAAPAAPVSVKSSARKASCSAPPAERPLRAGGCRAVAQPIKQQAPSPRMPRVEDFPPTVKAEVDAQAERAADQEDRGPMGLLKAPDQRPVAPRGRASQAAGGAAARAEAQAGRGFPMPAALRRRTRKLYARGADSGRARPADAAARAVQEDGRVGEIPVCGASKLSDLAIG